MKTTKKQIVMADFVMKGSVEPYSVTSFPIRRPKYASLDPVVVDLRCAEGDLKVWFLGNGYMRIEWNTTFLAGKQGALMMSCIQVEKTGEYDSESDATEEGSDSEKGDEESGSEEEGNAEGDREQGDSKDFDSDSDSDCYCKKYVRFWDGIYGGH